MRFNEAMKRAAKKIKQLLHAIRCLNPYYSRGQTATVASGSRCPAIKRPYKSVAKEFHKQSGNGVEDINREPLASH